MCMGPPKRQGNLHTDLRVYPHVYGSTSQCVLSTSASLRLSPCVWGHHPIRTLHSSNNGSIPMCMGPPFFHSLFNNAVWVYPHVYGATDMPATPSLTNLGLSPCVWGHLAQSAEDLGIKGSIPMCMGPPKQNRYAANPSRVYPHVYGAT